MIAVFFVCGHRESSESPQLLSKREQDYYKERQDLAVEFIFCLVLTEILQQVPVNYIHVYNVCVCERERELLSIYIQVMKKCCDRKLSN